jgi:hypothetical protein
MIFDSTRVALSREGSCRRPVPTAIANPSAANPPTSSIAA